MTFSSYLFQVPFERVFGIKIGEAVQKFHESHGVCFKMQAIVSHFEPSGTSNDDYTMDPPLPLPLSCSKC
jgi:hypothetical protein